MPASNTVTMCGWFRPAAARASFRNSALNDSRSLSSTSTLQRLDRDQPRQQRVVRRVHRAEAALAELVLQRVAADVADRRRWPFGRSTDGSAKLAAGPRIRRMSASSQSVGVGGQARRQRRGGLGVVRHGHGRWGERGHRGSLAERRRRSARKAPGFPASSHTLTIQPAGAAGFQSRCDTCGRDTRLQHAAQPLDRFAQLRHRARIRQPHEALGDAGGRSRGPA